MKQLHAALLTCLFCLATATACPAGTLPDVVEKIKPSIVGIGTYLATRRPPNQLLGTGFVVGDGQLVVTNAHVVPVELDSAKKETLAIFSGRGKESTRHLATLVHRDSDHDLAILRLDEGRLPAMTLGSDAFIREGSSIAFTGFPIGAVLGLYPVTHTGIVSAITPIVIPASTSRELTARQIKALRDPYLIYQLDATAYPGNSGSPMYDAQTGEVLAIINMVFVKGRKENVLKDPSAITYAIPVKYLNTILQGIKQ